MNYISTPIAFQRTDNEKGVIITRDIEERITMMDRLVELIVFTARGSFNADPDFGLEYWNHEYSNVSDSQFNNNIRYDEYHNEGLKERCEKSIAQSIIAYAPEKLKLSDVRVTMNLMDDIVHQRNRPKRYSHHQGVIQVTANFDDGMGTKFRYNSKELFFMTEPMARRK